MAKFNDLPESDRIQYIKDGFALILEHIAREPDKLSTYVKLEKPKLIVPVLEKIDDNLSEEAKLSLAKMNAETEVKVVAANEKMLEEFKIKEAECSKILETIKSLQTKEGCLCGDCVNINITNSMIPTELEILIDAARKEAEERTY